MNIVLGFGRTEEEQRNIIKERIKETGLEATNKEFKDRAEIYDKQSKEEAPERYTYFYAYDNKIIFFHINRRHAFSPDGWALLRVEEDFNTN